MSPSPCVLLKFQFCYWFIWWFPTGHIGFLCSFSSSFLCSPLTGLFQSARPLASAWPILLLMLSIAFFVSFTEFCCSRICLVLLVTFVKFLILLMYWFLILLNCLHGFFSSSTSFLKTAILNSLSSRLRISMSLGLVLED